MAAKKTITSKQFSESFEFIQTLFQEQNSFYDKVKRWSRKLVIILLWLLAIVLVTSMVWISIQYDVLSLTFSQDGVFLPKRR